MTCNDPISMYLSNSKEEFINKLAETIYSSRKWVDDEKASKSMIFYAMLGYIVHTQGWNKLSVQFQLGLMEACEEVSSLDGTVRLLESLASILEKFTKIK